MSDPNFPGGHRRTLAPASHGNGSPSSRPSNSYHTTVDDGSEYPYSSASGDRYATNQLPGGPHQISALASRGNMSTSSRPSNTYSVAADNGSERSYSSVPDDSSTTNHQPRATSDLSPELRSLLFAYMERYPHQQMLPLPPVMDRNGLDEVHNDLVDGPEGSNANGGNPQQPTYEGNLVNGNYQRNRGSITNPHSRHSDMYPLDGRRSVSGPRRTHTDHLFQYVTQPNDGIPIPGPAGIGTTSDRGVDPYSHLMDDGQPEQAVMPFSPDSRLRYEVASHGAGSPPVLSGTAMQLNDTSMSYPPDSYNNSNRYYANVGSISAGWIGSQQQSFLGDASPMQQNHTQSGTPNGSSSRVGSSQNHEEEEMEEYYDEGYHDYLGNRRSD